MSFWLVLPIKEVLLQYPINPRMPCFSSSILIDVYLWLMLQMQCLIEYQFFHATWAVNYLSSLLHCNLCLVSIDYFVAIRGWGGGEGEKWESGIRYIVAWSSNQHREKQETQYWTIGYFAILATSLDAQKQIKGSIWLINVLICCHWEH